MTAADKTNDQIRQERHLAGLKRQRELLDGIPLLKREDVIRVLHANPGAVLVLSDFENATLVIPAFQFLHDEDGEFKRNEAGLPLLNKDVLKVFYQLNPGMSALNIVQGRGAWDIMYWWVTAMRLDHSNPESRDFRPIDVVHDSQTLHQLADRLKDRNDESYG